MKRLLAVAVAFCVVVGGVTQSTDETEAALATYTSQLLEGAYMVYSSAYYLEESGAISDEKFLEAEESLDNLALSATALEELYAEVFPDLPLLSNFTFNSSYIDVPSNPLEAQTVGFIRMGKGIVLVSNASAGIMTDQEVLALAISTNISQAIIDVVSNTEDVYQTLSEISAPPVTTVGRRRLQQTDCSPDWTTIEEEDWEEYSQCTPDDFWGSITNLWDSVKQSFNNFLQSIDNVWNDFLDYECKFLNYLGDDVEDFLEEDNRLKPCTNVGCNDECIQPLNDGSPSNGTVLIQDSCDWIGDDEQRWDFKKVSSSSAPPFLYRIVSHEWDDLCITAPPGVGQAYLGDCESNPQSGSQQVFEVKELTKGFGGWGDDRFILQSTASGLCLGVEKNDDDEGLKFIASECTCGPQQAFKGDE